MSATAGNAAPDDGPPPIELRDVTKAYGQGQAAFQALRGVDLRLRQSDFVAVMGPSGSGTSTAMNISSAVWIARRRARVAFVGCMSNTYPATARAVAAAVYQYNQQRHLSRKYPAVADNGRMNK